MTVSLIPIAGGAETTSLSVKVFPSASFIVTAYDPAFRFVAVAVFEPLDQE